MEIRLVFDLEVLKGPDGMTLPAGETFDAVRIFSKEKRMDGSAPLTFNATRFHPDLVEVIARPGEYTFDLAAPLARLQGENIRSQIQKGYKSWIAEPLRARSGESDSGGWWSLNGDGNGSSHRWSVSWIQDTGELYARNDADDEYILLAVTAPGDEKAADALLQGWESPESPIYENLQTLFDRIRN